MSRNAHKQGRNVGNGRFTSVEKARNRPSTHVVEHVPLPGKGSKSSVPIGRDAGNGRFTTIEKAENNPGTHEVDRIPRSK